MPTVKLTDAAVQRLTAPPGERVDFFDAAFPGLALRVTGAVDRRPARRTWTWFYRFRGKQRRLTFGDYSEKLGLAAARSAATNAQMKLRAGQDPAAERAAIKDAAKRRADTVSAVCDLYLAHLARRQKSPVYVRETRRNLDNHVLPRWGDRDVTTIKRRDVIELINTVMDAGSTPRGDDGKRRKLSGGPVMANRTLAAVRGMLNFAIDELEIPVAPIRKVQGPGIETLRDRVLTADEIRALWPRWDRLGYAYGPALQLMLVLGQRRGEVAGMRWSDVDLAEAAWSLPASSTKAGRLSIVPLPKLAVEILKGLPRLGAFVFTVGDDKPICGFSSALARLAKIEGEPVADWVVHDLRRTAATEMGRLGASEFIIGKVLNHAAIGVTGKIYNRYEYMAEKRHALEAWATYLGDLTDPPERKVITLATASRSHGE